jgi:Zn-finger nucleic acid-binding protein
MKCPVDGNTLMITERAGVEIDYCPQCRGVWLDRGELDKIIAHGGAEAQSHDRQDYERRDKSPKKRKSGFGLIEELFDF